MGQIIIVAVLFLYLNTAVLAANKQFELLSKSIKNSPEIVRRYADNHLASRDEPNFFGGVHPRSMDHSLSFLVEADLARREFGGPVIMIERRSDLGQKKSPDRARSGSPTSSTPSASGGSRYRSPFRMSEGRNPSQGDAKVIISRKGMRTWSHTASERGQQDASHRSTWSGATGNKVTGIANAKGTSDKLKLDATGKKAVAEVHMTGDGNAILRSHGPQGTDTKMLIGGPGDPGAIFQPQHEAYVKATSDDPDKKASVSIKTTGAVHAKVKASANDVL